MLKIVSHWTKEVYEGAFCKWVQVQGRLWARPGWRCCDFSLVTAGLTQRAVPSVRVAEQSREAVAELSCGRL